MRLKLNNICVGILLCAFSLDAMDQPDNSLDRLPIIGKLTPEIMDALHIKTYSFSKPTLLIDLCVTAMFTGKVKEADVDRADLIKLLEYHAQEDENALQKLYQFRNKPVGSVNFADVNKAHELLNQGVNDYQVWALQEKATLLEDKKGITPESVSLHIKLAHMELAYRKNKDKSVIINKSIELLEKFFGGDHQKIVKYCYGRPLIAKAFGKNKKNKKNIKDINTLREQAAAFGDLNGLYPFDHLSKVSNDVIIMLSKIREGDILNEVANYLFGLEQLEQAFDFYSRAASLGNVYSMGSMGDILKKQGKMKKALEYYMTAGRLGYKNAAFCAGQYLKQMGRFDEALPFCTSVAQERPWAAFYTAEIYLAKNEPDKALYYFALAKTIPMSHFRTAVIYLENGDNENAQKCFIQATYAKANSEAAFMASEYFFRMKKYTESLKFLKEAQRINKWSSTDLIPISKHNEAILELKSFENHKVNVRRAIELFKQSAQDAHADSMSMLSKLYIILGSTKEALFWYEKSKANNAEHIDELDNIVANHQNLKDNKIIEELNKEAIKESSQSCINAIVHEIKENMPTLEVPILHDAQEIILDDETSSEEEVYPSFEEYNQKKSEAKQLRDSLIRINILQSQVNKNKITSSELTTQNQYLWVKIKDQLQNIELNDLIAFSEDPVFEGRLSHKKTKSGIIFKAQFGESGTVSTHRKHNKSYRGINASFKKDFCELISIVFGL